MNELHPEGQMEGRPSPEEAQSAPETTQCVVCGDEMMKVRGYPVCSADCRSELEEAR